MNCGKFLSTFELGPKNYGKRNVVSQSRSPNSSSTSLSVSKGKPITSDKAREHVVFPALDDMIEHCVECQEDYSHLSDFGDSYEELYSEKQRNLEILHKDLITSSSCSQSYKTPIKSLVDD